MLTTREVVAATGVHARTLDTWVKRGHLRPPLKQEGVLYWLDETVDLCLERVRKHKERPPREPDPVATLKRELRIAERQRNLALAWLTQKIINGGTLPLADRMLTTMTATRRLEEILQLHQVSIVETRSGVILRYPRQSVL